MLLDLDEFLLNSYDLEFFLYFSVLVCAFSIWSVMMTFRVFINWLQLEVFFLWILFDLDRLTMPLGFLLAGYSSKSFSSCRCFLILVGDDSWGFIGCLQWDASRFLSVILAGCSSKSWEGIYEQCERGFIITLFEKNFYSWIYALN